MAHAKPYLEDELYFLHENYRQKTDEELAEATGRTKRAITKKLSVMGLKRDPEERMQGRDAVSRMSLARFFRQKREAIAAL